MNVSHWRGVLLCLVATVSWGGMFPVMTDALTRMDPYTFTSLRYGIAGAAFAIALVIAEGWRGLSLKGERGLLARALGTIGFVGFGYFVFLGQKLAGPSGALNASVMMATMPMLGVLVNCALGKATPTAASFLFILISFGGVASVITKGDFSALVLHPQNYSASLLIVIGALCWVLYTIGPAFFPAWSPYRYTAITSVLGVISLFVLNAIFLAAHVVSLPSSEDLIFVVPHLAYMAIVAGFIAVLCWNFGNKILTPQIGVLFQDVVPVTSFIVSTLQGIVPAEPQIVGAAITGSALILNNLYLRRMKRAEMPPHEDLSS